MVLLPRTTATAVLRASTAPATSASARPASGYWAGPDWAEDTVVVTVVLVAGTLEVEELTALVEALGVTEEGLTTGNSDARILMYLYLYLSFRNKVDSARLTVSSSLDSARGTPQPGLDVSRPHVRLGAGPTLQLAHLPPPPHQHRQRGGEVGGGQHQQEAQADEHDPGQLHPVVSEGDLVLVDVVQGRGGDGDHQAEGDEVLVRDDHAEVGQHVGNCNSSLVKILHQTIRPRERAAAAESCVPGMQVQSRTSYSAQ